MKRLLSLVFLLWSSVAFAQTPTPVVPGYQVCTNKSGSTQCSFIPTSSTTPLPVTSAGSGGSSPPTGTTTQVAVAPTAATFSSLLVPNTSRKDCTIQNSGATLGYIYFGSTGSATTSNSFQLPAGGSLKCSSSGVIPTDNVAGTCASGTCAFIVSSQ